MSTARRETAGQTVAPVESFRADFRAWLDENLPAAWCRRAFPAITPPGEEDPEGVAISRAWQRVLHDGGWAAPGWPAEYGGRGLDLVHRLAVVEELAAAKAPVPIGFQGLDLLGPTLIQHANAEQKAEHLPGILSGDEIWCQGYSEPEAGSDLASLTTTARLDGDHYVVNGHKVWTSFGRRATWCFLLARTGEPGSRHRGISFLVTPMDAAGLEWRPIIEPTGSESFGELFLDDVRIPVQQRIGTEGAGWGVAMASLGHERLLSSNVAHIRARYRALLDLGRERGTKAAHRDQACRLGERLVGLEGMQARALDLALAEDQRFPVWASMVKLRGTELRQQIALLANSIIGAPGCSPAYGRGVDPDDVAEVWAHELVDSRGCTIYAGSSEIQRNIIGERGLGLPREAS